MTWVEFANAHAHGLGEVCMGVLMIAYLWVLTRYDR